MDIGGFLTSAFGGGLTGLVGHGLKEYVAYKRLKAEAEIKREDRAHELTLAKVGADGQREVAAFNALAESHKNDRAAYATGDLTPGQKWLMVIVDFTRGMTRPGITWFGVITLTFISGLTTDLVLKGRVVEALVYVTVTAVTWWFADRMQRK